PPRRPAVAPDRIPVRQLALGQGQAHVVRTDARPLRRCRDVLEREAALASPHERPLALPGVIRRMQLGSPAPQLACLLVGHPFRFPIRHRPPRGSLMRRRAGPATLRPIRRRRNSRRPTNAGRREPLTLRSSPPRPPRSQTPLRRAGIAGAVPRDTSRSRSAAWCAASGGSAAAGTPPPPLDPACPPPAASSPRPCG